MRVVEGLELLGTRFVPNIPRDLMGSKGGRHFGGEAAVAGAVPPTPCRHIGLVPGVFAELQNY